MKNFAEFRTLVASVLTRLRSEASWTPKRIRLNAQVAGWLLAATRDEIGESLLSEVTVHGERALQRFLDLEVCWSKHGQVIIED